MRYKLLGRSGLRVSELCLGTMTFGEEWGWGAYKAESRKIFDAFASAGRQRNSLSPIHRERRGNALRSLCLWYAMSGSPLMSGKLHRDS